MPANRREPAKEATATGSAAPRILKKYPNRRLYDTRTSSYITLADVKEMVLSSEDFEVRDAKSGEDLTRSILLQIILEEESGGVPMFTSQMLAQIIRFYGHAMQGLMGQYLERNLQIFTDLQGKLMEAPKGLADPAEAWTQLMSQQAPAMGQMMNSYLEQSRSMFEAMQEQMKLPGAIFPGVPGVPGFTPREGKDSKDSKDKKGA